MLYLAALLLLGLFTAHAQSSVITLEPGAAADSVLEALAAAGNDSAVSVQGSYSSAINTSSLPPVSFHGSSLELSNLTLYNVSLWPVGSYAPLNHTTLRARYARPSPPYIPQLLQPSWLVVANRTNLSLVNVHMVTDCGTLYDYQSYFCAGAWKFGFEANSTYLFVPTWSSDSLYVSNVTLTCSNPAELPTLCPCVITTAANADEVFAVAQLQPYYSQVVFFLTNNISFIEDVPEPCVVYRPTMLIGKPGTLTYMDFAFKWDVASVNSSTGLWAVFDLVFMRTMYKKSVMALQPTTWSLLRPSYFVINLPFLVSQGPFLYAFNTSMWNPCDYLEYENNTIYQFLNVASSNKLFSGDSFSSTTENFTIAPMIKDGLYYPTGRDIDAFYVNMKITCQPAPGPPGFDYSGMMVLSHASNIPATQIFGVANASALLARITYAQGLARLAANRYTLVMLKNISFADHDAALPAVSHSGNASSWPVVLRVNVLWGRWGKTNVTLDFAFRRNLFRIEPGITVELRNLTLARLPCLCDGSQLGVWGAALWPFTYDRLAPSRLALMDVMLGITWTEWQAMKIVVGMSNGGDTRYATDTLGGIRGSYVMAADRETAQFQALSGLGYEATDVGITTRTITLTTTTQTLTFPPRRSTPNTTATWPIILAAYPELRAVQGGQKGTRVG